MKYAVVLSAALLILACPGNQKTEDASRVTPSKPAANANPQAVPENSTRFNPPADTGTALPSKAPPAAGTSPIQVQLIEYEIRMPDTITAGVHTFHIVNGGHYNHSFAIEGNGVSEKLAADLPRGDDTNLSIQLPPGTYTVFCPVDGHRGKGMQRTLTVK